MAPGVWQEPRPQGGNRLLLTAYMCVQGGLTAQQDQRSPNRCQRAGTAGRTSGAGSRAAPGAPPLHPRGRTWPELPAGSTPWTCAGWGDAAPGPTLGVLTGMFWPHPDHRFSCSAPGTAVRGTECWGPQGQRAPQPSVCVLFLTTNWALRGTTRSTQDPSPAPGWVQPRSALWARMWPHL